jgi:molybdenum cofactor synthesis domain-containing protein
MSKTAAILIIGNEILSGKVSDENGSFLAGELRSLGVDVRRIVVLPDEVGAIAEEAAACTREFDWIFTTGGVGPTHDDVTIHGIASGLGREVIRHPVIASYLRDRYGSSVNEAVLKLAEIPEGAELIEDNGLHFPVILVSNFYLFPGIPRLVQKKFTAIRERFRDAPFRIRRVFLDAGEEAIAHHLHSLLQSFPGLLLGSYPATQSGVHRVVLTLESKDPAYLESACKELLRRLPAETIRRTE